MSGTVWCVFQRLAGESCSSLSAVCRTREVAEEIVQIGEAESRADGDGGCDWTISRWDILDGEVKEVEDARRISHVLDPQRQGVALTEMDGGADAATG